MKSEKYSGQFKQDQFHGNGVHVNEAGDIYDGEFEYGKKHGLGNLQLTYKPAKGEEGGIDYPISLSFLGEFKSGKYDGQGQIKIEPMNNEEKLKDFHRYRMLYNGSFVGGKRDGHGEMYWNTKVEEQK